MWFSTVTRRKLLDIYRSGEHRPPNIAHHPDGQRMISSSGHDLITLLWSDKAYDRADLPAVLVVDGSVQRDLLAWMLTYLPDFSPMTAMVRVVDQDTVNSYLEIPSQPSSKRVIVASVGLILGEALSHMSSRGSPQPLTLQGCEWTCSYCLARGLSTNVAPKLLQSIPFAWSRARQITRQTELRLKPREVLAVWSVLINIATDYPLLDDSLETKVTDELLTITTACVQVFEGHELSKDTIDFLLKRPRNSELQFSGDSHTREQRVREFATISEEAVLSPHSGSLSTAFGLAYVASQIAPGTIDHYQLLVPVLDSFPTILLWYGLLAGLSTMSSLQAVGKGLTPRITRDMVATEHFLERPQCDVALNELELIVSMDRPREIRSVVTNLLEVELIPCVTTFLRWPKRQEDSIERNPALDNLVDMQSTVSEIGEVLAYVEDLRGRLASFLDMPNETRDRPSKRKRNR